MLLRGALGYALFCVGGATVAFSGGRYAMGEWRQAAARQAWEETEARTVVARARHASEMDPHASPVVDGSPVARLLIPRLGVDAIVLEGVDGDVLNAGPGHVKGSAFPGERGNAVISAHRDRHFAKLGELRIGDTLVTESGMRRTWVVTAKRVIAAAAPALFHTTEATLTLTTCWPIRWVGSAPDRLLVTAKPIDAKSSFASGATN